mmetsp:Transcript_20724/g.43737  ORF Transcript_20724/g.43737 Transcript_20724/m.43737 type:complete len:381 (+) Transcript_20724:280-1422(+)
MDRYGMPSVEAIRFVKTTEEFLSLFKMLPLLPLFTGAGITTAEQLCLLTPTALDAIEAQHGASADSMEVDSTMRPPAIPAGQRKRLLRALALLQEAKAVAHSDAAVEVAQATAADVDRRQPNSTSSLYIESTIAHPDMAQICFCVSLLVHDLIVQAEYYRAQTNGNNGFGAGSAFAMIRPREIFALPGKRSRQEFESDQPEEREVPSEEDIRFAIYEIHKISHFSPGCLVVAMIYLERLRRSVGAELLGSTWQLLLLTAIIVAQKMWEDRPISRIDFTPLSPSLKPHQLGLIEREFLRMLDYHFTISAGVYTEWYFKLCELCERNEVRMKPLSQAEASKLEIRSHNFSNQIKSNMQGAMSGPVAVGYSSDAQSGGRVILG